MSTALVHGLAITGTSVIRALRNRGYDVMCSDDRNTEDNRATADQLGVKVHLAPTDSELRGLVDGCDFVVPAPGVRELHPVRMIAAELGKSCVSELDLAYEWESARAGGGRPMVAVTGTDGKTTTTSLTAHIIREAGLKVIEAGNTDVPLVEAIDDHDIDAFVVECSSFRLANINKFRTKASTWLNFSPDHLDWHSSLDTYRGAKERIWANATAEDVAVYPVGSQSIADVAKRSEARKVSFGIYADYTVSGGALTAHGTPIMSVATMWRTLPHDIDNSLAAAALAIESGLATAEHAEQGIATFVPPHHRIEFINEIDGVRWYDDSKATTPHAARAAIRSFHSVVLIAGGRNKDLDLSELALEKDHIKAVVATGEGIDAITAVFAGVKPVYPAHSMTEAVRAAASVATAGDTVLLSPACTSFDWYRNYNERGDDFVRCVREVLGS